MSNALSHTLPLLTQARAPLTHRIAVTNEHGEQQALDIPAERPLTVYVDKRELVTLMTLGERPEWLVLGYLLNQRLVPDASAVESITVDWEVGAAAVKTRGGIVDMAQKTAKRVGPLPSELFNGQSVDPKLIRHFEFRAGINKPVNFNVDQMDEAFAADRDGAAKSLAAVGK